MLNARQKRLLQFADNRINSHLHDATLGEFKQLVKRPALLTERLQDRREYRNDDELQMAVIPRTTRKTYKSKEEEKASRKRDMIAFTRNYMDEEGAENCKNFIE